jgi:predicted dehydrogenase
MIRVGLVGYGYWGPNLARNFARSPEFELTRIVDIDPRRLQAAAHDHPRVESSTDPEAVLHAPDLDAVAIATPIHTHASLALEALRHDKHVLVEKPMADSVAGAEQLVAEAERRRLVLLVDHTLVYTAWCRWIQEFVAAGKLGDLFYFDAMRANLGLFRRDVSVVWDLAPHDLAVLQEVIARPVLGVSATGSSHAGSRVPSIAYISLDLGAGSVAHLHVSWLSPVRMRRLLVAGSKSIVLFDEAEARERLKVYDSGATVVHTDSPAGQMMSVEYRVGDVLAPALQEHEALQEEVAHFAACIQGKETPRAGGQAGLAVVRILEAAQRSLEKNGDRVLL